MLTEMIKESKILSRSYTHMLKILIRALSLFYLYFKESIRKCVKKNDPFLPSSSNMGARW